MSTRMLDLLLRQYPGQVALDVDQVACVLDRAPDTVRDWMRAGKLPGARKVGKRWMMPLPDLAEVLEPAPTAPRILSLPRVVRAGVAARRRRAIVMN